AEALQDGERVGALEDELGEGGLIEDDYILAAGALLLEDVGEPAGRVERRRRFRGSVRQEVVRPLPVELATEHRALRPEAGVERGPAQTPAARQRPAAASPA